MNNSLYSLLEKFSAEEWKDFGLFINSPYHTKGRDFSGLYKFFRKYFSVNKSAKGIEEKILKSSIYSSMSRQAFRNRLSDLNKLGEKFLVEKHLEEHKVNRFSILSEALTERELHTNFITTYNNTKKRFSGKETNENPAYSRIIHSLGFYERSRNNMQKAYEHFDEYVNCVNANSLDMYIYFASEYFLMEEYGIRKDPELFRGIFREINLEKIIKKIEESGNGYYNKTLLRFYVYEALVNYTKHGSAARAENFFGKIRDEISADLKKFYYMKMHALFVLRFNKGDYSILKKLFALMNDRLEDGETIDFSKSDYPASEFRDYVILALKLNEYGWAENFINKYYMQLNPLIRDDERDSAMIRLYTARKNFIGALNTLNKRKKSASHVQNIDMYIYEIKIYYEMKYFNDMELAADRLKHYLRKEQVLRMQKNSALKFLSYLKRIAKIKTENAAESAEDLRNEIAAEKEPLMDKKWLIEKVM